jgi:hypothetical protein
MFKRNFSPFAYNGQRNQITLQVKNKVLKIIPDHGPFENHRTANIIPVKNWTLFSCWLTNTIR